jgi:hypothetical protein
MNIAGDPTPLLHTAASYVRQHLSQGIDLNKTYLGWYCITHPEMKLHPSGDYKLVNINNVKTALATAREEILGHSVQFKEDMCMIRITEPSRFVTPQPGQEPPWIAPFTDPQP